MASLAVGTQVGQSAWLSVSEAGTMLGVSPSTVRNMVRVGELEARRSIGGHRRVSRDSVCRWLGLDTETESTDRGTVVYARVSQNKQKVAGNLERQVDRLSEHCQSEYGAEPVVIAEVGSGLKEDRAGYLRLIDLVLSGKVERVVVEHEDRIARYGVKVFRALCDRMGVELIVTATEDSEGDLSPEAEMTADILSLCTVYAARTHGRRGADHKRMEVTPEARERILALHKAGLNQTAIVEHLQCEGFKCPRQNKPYAIHSVRATIQTAAKVRGIVEVEAERNTLLDRFIAERCEQRDGATCLTKAFYEAYRAFAREAGETETVPNLNTLTYRMKRMGWTIKRHWSGHREYVGLGLLS